MKKYLISITMVLFLVISLGNRIAFTGQIFVSITNLTKDQPFSPPVLVSHNQGMLLSAPHFRPGKEASAGLELLAEDGDTSGLLSEIEESEGEQQQSQ